MKNRVDVNLISLNLWAKQPRSKMSALALDGDRVTLKTGHQTGEDLQKVILAVREAVNVIDQFSLRLQGIDLMKVVEDFRRRVAEFKQERRERLDTFGVVKSEDASLDSALKELDLAIANKTSRAKL